ncbi:MAG: hypothetical protein QXX71_03090 [Candidatus Nanoarchaeia archaeon]|nr:hypothetical protein [Candidatus Haiyanarchaeum thermophilum]MCW1303848.1 hypothetical protein [Candidatus Haiyanarchaeum thermophilum]MCW1306536.1 hypothetical protein [Candidatus Haiyanarchaeum thermophilum]MCW1306949.1 hypothetical protein [Candidatus Haiyanarchaeum thermophilum]
MEGKYPRKQLLEEIARRAEIDPGKFKEVQFKGQSIYVYPTPLRLDEPHPLATDEKAYVKGLNFPEQLILLEKLNPLHGLKLKLPSLEEHLTCSITFPEYRENVLSDLEAFTNELVYRQFPEIKEKDSIKTEEKFDLFRASKFRSISLGMLKGKGITYETTPGSPKAPGFIALCDENDLFLYIGDWIEKDVKISKRPGFFSSFSIIPREDEVKREGRRGDIGYWGGAEFENDVSVISCRHPSKSPIICWGESPLTRKPRKVVPLLTEENPRR